MDIVLPKKNLHPMLAQSLAIARSGKRRMPLLDHVLLEATESSLRVSASAVDWSLTSQTWAEVARAGAVAMPCEMTLAAVDALPDGPVRLTVAEHTDRLTIAGVASPRSFTVAGYEASKFATPAPLKPEVEPVRVPIGALATLLTWTRHAIGKDDTRAHLNALLLETADDRLRAWSTDGSRAHLGDVACETAGFPRMLVPRGAVLKLRALVAKHQMTEPSVTVASDGKLAWFGVAGFVLGTKLVNATFPPCNLVVPKKRALPVAIQLVQLLEVVRRAVALSEMSSSSTLDGAMRIALDRNTLRLSAGNPAGSWSARDEIVVAYDGPPVERLYRAGYMLDALEAMADENEVAMEVQPMDGGPLEPLLLRPHRRDDGANLLAVIMPVRA